MYVVTERQAVHGHQKQLGAAIVNMAGTSPAVSPFQGDESPATLSEVCDETAECSGGGCGYIVGCRCGRTLLAGLCLATAKTGSIESRA
jgi:hypothetical protein